MRVLFLSGMPGGTRRYRCVHHQEQLALQGEESVLWALEDQTGHPQLYAEVVASDLVVLHRAPLDPLVDDLIELAHGQGKPVVFETDDLVFPEFADQIAYLDTLPPAARRRFEASLTLQADALARADCVLTTTNALAEEAERRGKPAFIHRNAASGEMLRLSEEAYQERGLRGQEGPVTLGYFSGSGSHDRDFAIITPVLLALMAERPNLHLHVGGQLTLHADFDAFAERIHRTPFIPWQELPSLIARVDVNLSPLEQDSLFCQSKSEIKWMEAALVGVPTVASATDAFLYAIDDGKNSLIASSAEAWRQALVTLIEHPERRKTLGEAARRGAYDAYTPEKAGEHLVTVLHSIAARFGRESAPGSDVALNLAQRMQRHLARVQEERDDLARRLEALRNTHAELVETVRNVRTAERSRARQQIEQLERKHVETLRSLLRQVRRLEPGPDTATDALDGGWHEAS